MIIFNQLKRLSAVEGRVDTSSDTFYNRGYGTPSADCRIEERAGVLGKLTFTAGGFADDFEYSGHPLCDPPSGGVDRLGGRNLSLIFFSPPFFFYLFIYLYRVSPRWGEALGRNKMSFFQEKIFLTKKNIFRPGANALSRCQKKKKKKKKKKKNGVTTQTDSPRFFRGSSVGTPVRGVYFFFVVFGFRHPGGFETWQPHTYLQVV